MLTDLTLAIGHHLLMFALIVLLVMELMLVRPGLSGARLTYLGRLDLAFGIVAGLILVVGFGRVFMGLKPSAYYFANLFFWAKIAAFLTVGALSLPPTMRIVLWRRAVGGDAAFAPGADEVRTVRRFMHWEAVVFALIPIFAALMARGYGAL